ncbi:hypothetical protein J6590_103841 [Homalodisca vitripennis]|nr:hypothetical protein J6590_103841 [Homalodisca vitripennis]
MCAFYHTLSRFLIPGSPILLHKVPHRQTVLSGEELCCALFISSIDSVTRSSVSIDLSKVFRPSRVQGLLHNPCLVEPILERSSRPHSQVTSHRKLQ